MRLARGKLLPKLEESLLGIRVSLAGKNRLVPSRMWLEFEGGVISSL
jgi:hypothetical protein